MSRVWPLNRGATVEASAYLTDCKKPPRSLHLRSLLGVLWFAVFVLLKIEIISSTFLKMNVLFKGYSKLK